MLKRLKLYNFKSWPEAEVKFGRITGLFGANSSGKSSLMQFLLLLKQTKDSTDRAAALDLNGRFVELGTPANVIHGHADDSRLSFTLGFVHPSGLHVHDTLQLGGEPIAIHDHADDSRLSFMLGYVYPSELHVHDALQLGGESIARSEDIVVRARLRIHRGAFQSRMLAYKVGDAEFALKRAEGSDTKFDLVARVPESDFSFVRTRGRPWKLSGPVKTYRFPDEARTGFQNSGFLAELESAFEAALDKLYYLGPLRESPQRDYLWPRSRPADVGERGERTINAIIAAEEAGEKQNLWRYGRHQPFSHIVAHWLRELRIIDDFRIMEIAPGSNRWQAKVRTSRGAPEVMLTDVGFGVSQVLPVIVLLHYAPEGSTVLLEQPEIHLHPLAQAELAEVIIHAATHRKVQVVLESHSEHLLLRLQRRIAEDRVSADDVALYSCRMRDGASEIEPLDLDKFGNIQNWPPKFMGDAFEETAQAELARLDRMKNAAT